MESAQEKRYCDHCHRDTLHEVVEAALEIEYKCTECGDSDEVFKTFF